MKKKAVLLAFVSVFLSTTLSLCVVGLLELHMAYASPYTSIDVDTAYNMITNGSYPDLVVLDVRTKSEYNSGHIHGAVCIPVSELEARALELAGHENHEIIVYCRSGVRSVTASLILDSHNFTKVYNMLGGIQAWQSAGYPVSMVTVHDIAVIDVKPYKTVIGQNRSTSIFVTVENQGDAIEDFYVTVYYNTSIIGTQYVNGLAIGTETTLEFTWNTTGVIKGNYTLKAEASTVQDETDTSDNIYTDGTIKITIFGDISGNGVVDMRDIGTACRAFGSTPGDPKWVPNADINDDEVVDMRDLGAICRHFGETF